MQYHSVEQDTSFDPRAKRAALYDIKQRCKTHMAALFADKAKGEEDARRLGMERPSDVTVYQSGLYDGYHDAMKCMVD